MSQLRLHKSFCSVEELSTPDVGQVSDKHVTAGGFPHIRCAQQDMDADSDTDLDPAFLARWSTPPSTVT